MASMADIKISLDDEARELLEELKKGPRILRVGEKDTLVLCHPGRLSFETHALLKAEVRKSTGIQNVMILEEGMTPHVLIKGNDEEEVA